MNLSTPHSKRKSNSGPFPRVISRISLFYAEELRGDLPRPFSQSVNSREWTARSTPYGPISVLLKMETGTEVGTTVVNLRHPVSKQEAQGMGLSGLTPPDWLLNWIRRGKYLLLYIWDGFVLRSVEVTYVCAVLPQHTLDCDYLLQTHQHPVLNCFISS